MIPHRRVECSAVEDCTCIPTGEMGGTSAHGLADSVALLQQVGELQVAETANGGTVAGEPPIGLLEQEGYGFADGKSRYPSVRGEE